MLLSVNFPSWLKPEIIPGLPVRWYGLMYIVAFAIAYICFRKQVREINFPITDDQILSFFSASILGLILGARIFATIVYETSDYYIRQPWLIFWPFRNGRFTGLQGMSYHGGVIGCITGALLWCIRHHFKFRDLGDFAGGGIPLGYTFGRIGNFINGELYGRVTAGPLGMIFPNAERLSARLPWVREIAEKTGVAIPSPDAMVNLPRYPSQLFEAFFEGVFTWAIVWAVRKKKPFRGFLLAFYIMLYGAVRFILEYFREPDADLGYRIELVKNGIPPALFSSPLNFTTGQILCFLMIVGGGAYMFAASLFKDKKMPDWTETSETAKKKDDARNARRNLRKKLQGGR
jgi:phosphatidylglycerol:prolipoprotein diacylglycerol transferase